MKNIYPMLLSFTLWFTPALPSHPLSHALKSALDQENITHIQQLLASHKLDVNLTNNFGSTALMIAISQHHIPLLQLLLQRDDVHINKKNGFGSTALMLAIIKNYTTLAELLLQRNDININQQDIHGYTPLMRAVLGDHITLAKKLVKRHDLNVNLQNKHGYTALMLAIRENYIPLATQLLNYKNININLQNELGDTALILTAEKNHIEIAKKLFEYKNIHVNIQNQLGDTALMRASLCGNVKIAEQLLQREDIDTNLQDTNGTTALMLAIYRSNIKIAKQLIKRKNTNVNLHTLHKKTALTYIKPDHIDLKKPQSDSLYYVSLVKRTHIPSLDKHHPLLQPNYLQALYTQQPFTQTMQQYTDILLVNKIAHELEEQQKPLLYQGCLLAYESKNSNYSIQAKNITYPNPSSCYQPLLDKNLIHLLAGYLRNVKMKRVSYQSHWVHLITCYLCANNPFALQYHKTTLKKVYFWHKHHSPYPEFLDAANHTQERSLFNIAYQQGKYEAIATQHLAQALKQKKIIQKEDQLFAKSITQCTPIIVAGIKALNHQLAA